MLIRKILISLILTFVASGVLARSTQKCTEVSCCENIRDERGENPHSEDFSVGKFCLKMDKEKRGAILTYYLADSDKGNLKSEEVRGYHDCKKSRRRDKAPCRKIPCHMMQTSKETYGKHTYYDNGHMVPKDHFDHSKEAMRATNCMANIWPQQWKFNRNGAWRGTELIIECYRDMQSNPDTQDKGPLHVWSGPLWKEEDFLNDKGVNQIKESHGIDVPSHFWKIVYSERTGEVIAWIMPNSNMAKVKENLASVSDIEKETKLNFDDLIPKKLQKKKEKTKWILNPNNDDRCDDPG